MVFVVSANKLGNCTDHISYSYNGITQLQCLAIICVYVFCGWQMPDLNANVFQLQMHACMYVLYVCMHIYLVAQFMVCRQMLIIHACMYVLYVCIFVLCIYIYIYLVAQFMVCRQMLIMSYSKWCILSQEQVLEGL